MILLPPTLRLALRANDIARRVCDLNGARFDPVPVIKLFNPVGAATWLARELDEDGDTCSGWPTSATSIPSRSRPRRRRERWWAGENPPTLGPFTIVS